MEPNGSGRVRLHVETTFDIVPKILLLWIHLHRQHRSMTWFFLHRQSVSDIRKKMPRVNETACRQPPMS